MQAMYQLLHPPHAQRHIVPLVCNPLGPSNDFLLAQWVMLSAVHANNCLDWSDAIQMKIDQSTSLSQLMAYYTVCILEQ